MLSRALINSTHQLPLSWLLDHKAQSFLILSISCQILPSQSWNARITSQDVYDNVQLNYTVDDGNQRIAIY